MILTRHVERQEFTCASCKKDKKSKLSADAPEGIICNGCYGRKLAEARGLEDHITPSERRQEA
jgi:hypothetical protein